ncbi:HD domain-containing protein [Pedobacter sp. AW31-3R]|uniref:HD domain-containing protein n=1 Tax=Pedobacter sp. AW31-3R TaxID=3445781 RepID=UPI003F9FAC70
MIKVNDPIYGTVELPPIFEDLLQTKAIRRLEKIHHSGAIFLVNPEIRHSRLEHSIGVMLLIRILGGTELEQVAGLVHDLSHTTFSHVGDYVFGHTEEDYHEQIFDSVLLGSEVPGVLEKYGYGSRQILENDFTILEQPLPLLCADRLDYTLRDAMYARLITRNQALSFLELITLQDNRIVVKSAAYAEWINHIFKRLNKEVYNAPLYVYANQQIAFLIREFLKDGSLQEADLMKDDTFLLNKIRSTSYGFEAIRAIKRHVGYNEFLRKGKLIPIKHRHLDAPLLTMEK